MSGGPGSLQIEACVDCAILTESDHGQLRVRLTDARQFADGVRAANGSATADDADDADEDNGNGGRRMNHGRHGRHGRNGNRGRQTAGNREWRECEQRLKTNGGTVRYTQRRATADEVPLGYRPFLFGCLVVEERFRRCPLAVHSRYSRHSRFHRPCGYSGASHQFSGFLSSRLMAMCLTSVYCEMHSKPFSRPMPLSL